MKYIIWILLIGFSLGCKKDKSAGDDLPVSPNTGTRIEFTLDSIYLYARQVYLWNDVLPVYNIFNPRKYANQEPEFTALKKELFEFSQFKINPATELAYEFPVNTGQPKYSFIEKAGLSAGKTALVEGNTESGLLRAAVIDQAGIKVAYLAMGSFPALKYCKRTLDQVFSDFASSVPKYIIIDLRSNAGGYVETAEYIANLIAPSGLTGKVMYSEQFNAMMQAGKASILKNQAYLDDAGQQIIYKGKPATMADVNYTESGNTFLYNKKGNLESVTDVYFILSGKTASASEMLVSVMKPYLNVYTLGEKSYGKPIGFFGIKIDIYSLYLSGFLIKNSLGWADYFNGMNVDFPMVTATNPIWGDPDEGCLKLALTQIAKGSSRILQSKEPVNKTQELTLPEISGFLENRLKLKQ